MASTSAARRWTATFSAGSSASSVSPWGETSEHGQGRTRSMQDPWGAVLLRRATLGVGPALAAASPSGHVVLLGDSVLDNAGYLGGRGPDVVAQLRACLP